MPVMEEIAVTSLNVRATLSIKSMAITRPAPSVADRTLVHYYVRSAAVDAIIEIHYPASFHNHITVTKMYSIGAAVHDNTVAHCYVSDIPGHAVKSVVIDHGAVNN